MLCLIFQDKCVCMDLELTIKTFFVNLFQKPWIPEKIFLSKFYLQL